MFALLAPILLAAAVAQQAPADDTTNVECVEKLRLPAYPPLAKAARVKATLTVVVHLASDATADAVSISGENRALFVVDVEKSIRRSLFNPGCGGRSITLVFEFVFGDAISRSGQNTYGFHYPNRYLITAPPMVVNP
jgi:hypothetical protein